MKSWLSNINVSDLLYNYLFEIAHAEGPTSLVNKNFTVISAVSDESNSLNATLSLAILTITEPKNLAIASKIRKVTTQNIKWLILALVSSFTFEIHLL